VPRRFDADLKARPPPGCLHDRAAAVTAWPAWIYRHRRADTDPLRRDVRDALHGDVKSPSTAYAFVGHAFTSGRRGSAGGPVSRADLPKTQAISTATRPTPRLYDLSRPTGHPFSSTFCTNRDGPAEVDRRLADPYADEETAGSHDLNQ